MLAELTPQPITVSQDRWQAMVASLALLMCCTYIYLSTLARNLPENDPQVLYLFTAKDFPQLSHVKQKEVFTLFDQFKIYFLSTVMIIDQPSVSHTKVLKVFVLSSFLKNTSVVEWKIIMSQRSQTVIGHWSSSPSQSPWASLLLILKKKNGGHYIFINYQCINSLTKKNSYTLPCINDALQHFGGSKFSSAINLASGYYYIEPLSIIQTECCSHYIRSIFGTYSHYSRTL